MLVQLHFEYPDKTEFVAQAEIPDDATQKELDEIVYPWVKCIKKRHLLPEGCTWLLCDQKSRLFVWAADRIDPNKEGYQK